ncbi:MAG: IPT/TIG domain-containing protein, partial [Patescibacteria group bacterium]
MVLFGLISVFSPVFAQDQFGLEAAKGTGLGNTDLITIISNIIRIILGLLGVLGIILILYAGFVWMTASGDADKVVKAKKIITGAIIGLAITLAAFSIASFVISNLSKATGAEGGGGDGGGDGGGGGTITSNQYTFISGFKDTELDWQRGINFNFAGTVSIPVSSDLQIRGYGKNQGGTVEAMEFFAGENNLSKASDFASMPSNQEIVDNVFASWDTSSFTVGQNLKLKIRLTTGSGSTFESKTVNAVVRPLHCFNSVRDEGETKTDCGGTCDSCSGIPEITRISPADGAPRNYVTILGRNFGDEPGEISLTTEDGAVKKASLASASGCGDVWTDYQIVIEVPSMALGKTVLRVFNKDGLSSKGKDFTINNIVRPGICNMDPDHGVYPETTVITGNNFPTGGTKNVVWQIRPYNTTSSPAGWTTESVTENIPQNKIGLTSVRVFNGQQYSNDFRFLMTRGQKGDPCGWETSSCGASSVCQSGLVCDPSNDCTCQVPAETTCEPGTRESCDDFTPCIGAKVCGANKEWGSCVKTDPACSPSLGFNPATQSLYGWSFRMVGGNAVCNNNVLESGEACEIVNGSVVFASGQSGDCDYYQYGQGQVTCDSCAPNFSGCPLFGGKGVEGSATQSFYGWKFYLGDGEGGPPRVVEDCSRFADCRNGQKLPSPTPWSFEWNKQKHSGLDVTEP